MKKKVRTFLFVIVFFAGLSLLLYPFVANQWNNYRQTRLIRHYETALEEMEAEDFTAEWEKARAFNDRMEDTEYGNILNIMGDGVMGYLSIPKINVQLSIYHGVEDDVLQTGIGHLDGTNLPIGGESTHCVLAAHRGLPRARLFTDVDQLEKGDKFYIHVLDQVLAYEVDQILPMVEKDDYETLVDALKIEEGKDQVTLFTCTPYGVNSHRLLVRGSRVPYTGEEAMQSLPQAMVKTVQNDYMLYLMSGLAVTVLGILIMKVLFGRRRRRYDGK